MAGSIPATLVKRCLVQLLGFQRRVQKAADGLIATADRVKPISGLGFSTKIQS